MLPDFLVAKDIEEHRLVHLLPDHQPVEQPIFAFYAQRQYTPEKVRVFVDFLIEAFSPKSTLALG
ncbi:hypothetical protein D9M72_595040 [compost metagenome]